MVKIAVLGTGLMGIKIAGEFAYHGHRVKIYSNDSTSLNSVYERMEEDKRYLKASGILLNKNFVGQVLCLSKLEEAVNDADFILECISEDIQMKKDLFERVSHLCKSSAVIVSNTLRLNMNEIVERTVGKERTLGLRFLFPVYYVPEVEITPNKFTSGQSIEKVRSLLQKMGKVLFFRSGTEPHILTEEQREEKRMAKIQQMKTCLGMSTYPLQTIPSLSQSMGQGEGNHGAMQSTDAVETSNGDVDCAICMDKPRDCVMRPCHHMVICYSCATMLINRRDGCPICRKDIVEIIKIYSG